VTAAQSLRIRLLGGLDVEGVAVAALGSRKARRLLKALALGRGAPVPADRLVEVVWGDDPPARPAEQLGVLVSRLRATVGKERLPRTDAGWTLRADWVDVEELDARATEAAARLEAGQWAAAGAAATAALQMVRGPLLPEEEGEWIDDERRSVERTIGRVRLVGAEAALAAGDAPSAAAIAEGGLDADPYDEACLRLLMRAHAAAGRPASALAAYARVRAAAAADLGVDLTRETEDLHTAILIGSGDEERAEAAAVDLSRPMLAGRHGALAALDAVLGRATAGDAVLTVVEGEAGIGKTALVDHWVATAPAGLVLRGRSDELGRDLPLQPVLDGLHRHLRALDDAAAAALLGAEATVIGPLLGSVSRAAGPAGQTLVRDAAADQAVLFASLLAVVERAAAGEPVVLVVDDVHLAGASTVEWLGFAARRGRRLLLLVTRRAGEGLPLGDAVTVELGPLDLDAAAAIVGPERAAALHARSGGNPLFLVELAASNGDELPATVRDSVRARVDSLGSAAPTIRAAAVLGPQIDVDLLAAGMRIGVADLLEHLESGVRARLLDERGATLAFRHELVRESLAIDVGAARRAYLHREAARLLAARPAGDPLEVAWHAQRGGDEDLAAAALLDASAAAAARFDQAAAEAHATAALDHRDSASGREARARIRLTRWELAGAAEDAAGAVRLGGGGSAYELAGWIAYYSRDYDAARRYAAAGIDAAADDPALRSSCRSLTGRISHTEGALPDADAALTLAIDEAPPALRGVAQVWLASLRTHQGDPAAACDLVAAALVDPTRLAHPFAELHGLFAKVVGLASGGDPVGSWTAAQELAAVADRAGEQGRRFQAVARNLEGWLRRGVGRAAEADELNREALDLSAAPGRENEPSDGMAEPRHVARLDLADGCLQRGDLVGAAAMLDQAAGVESWFGAMSWHQRDRRHLLLARFALASGDAHRAAELAATVASDSSARGARRYEAFANAVLARARVALGDPVPDSAALAAILDALDACAALESWWYAAELAAATRVDALWPEAERRAVALAASAGEDGEQFRSFVAARLDLLRGG
jgi:DNA-binding SARP family transcriptional activator